MSKTVAILLVSPENPDNIGAVARAMKNMALDDLRLVNPPKGWKEKAKKMAVAAADVLEKAKVFKAVSAALKDRQLVIGTTRRQGPKRGTFLSFDEAIKKIKENRDGLNIAVMFGRESKGLDNDSLNLCDWMTTIPANPEYPSINLAQSVILVAFSLFDHDTKLPLPPPKRGSRKVKKEFFENKNNQFISKEEMEVTLERVYEALKVLNYGDRSGKADRIRAVLHRLFKRSGLLDSEAQMFKGLSRRICERGEDRSRSF